jgi:hypothetical protein
MYINNTTVISLCSIEHAEVWRLTSRLLPRYVVADKYVVYVPNDQVSKFIEITDSRIEVLSEDLLGNSYINSLKEKVKLSGNLQRYGWYLQQFYKIEALLLSNSNNVIIWDSDCVPVREIKLFTDNQRPVYMQASTEFNPIYFKTIEKILGMQRVHDFSFIIPGFPIPSKWAQEFVQYIADHYELNWYDSIIKNTPFQEMSGFSEYETLGTWVANKYPNSWSKIEVKWERLGQSRFGYARDFNEESIVAIGETYGLHVISFENWDHRGIKKYLNWIKVCLQIKNSNKPRH